MGKKTHIHITQEGIMSYTNTKTILAVAREHHFAHGAFNVNSLSQARSVIEACALTRTAAIIQVAEPGLAFLGGNPDFLHGTPEEKALGAKRIADYVIALAKEAPIPVALHLDHGRSFETAKACVDAGFNSVMIDGSALPYEENAALAKKVVEYAHPRGVSVEAELGVLAGREDHVFAASSTYTNPITAVRFIQDTGADLLAISYGTKHGAVKGDDVKLRKEIVIATMENFLHEGIDAVLVSHGSSLVPPYIIREINALGGKVSGKGIPVEQLQEVIPLGISKINMDTDIRLATTRNIREYFAADPRRKQGSKIWPLMEEKPESFEYRYYLRDYIEGLDSGRITSPEMEAIAPLMDLGVKEIVTAANAYFGCFGDADLIGK